MTDTEKLRNIIKEKGLKLKYVANYLGLSEYGFALKIGNKKEFKAGEITMWCELLGITKLSDKEAIFFKK